MQSLNISDNNIGEDIKNKLPIYLTNKKKLNTTGVFRSNKNYDRHNSSFNHIKEDTVCQKQRKHPFQEKMALLMFLHFLNEDVNKHGNLNKLS